MYRIASSTNKKTISFYWNGKKFNAVEGDTLASALMANGEKVLARSFKFGRKRGLLSYGVEEPNVLVTLEPNTWQQIPNVKATDIRVYPNMRAIAATVHPSITFDWRAFLQPLHRFMPVGFYYKTFKWPLKYWRSYERLLRQFAGFSKHNPNLPDQHEYLTRYSYCDILIVGGGIAGIKAAVELGASQSLRIIIAEQSPELGGESLADIHDQAAQQTLSTLISQLHALDNITVLCHTTVFGLYDNDKMAQALETITTNNSQPSDSKLRQRLHHIRMRKTLLATGAHERTLLFSQNDLPGILLASAARRYLNCHGVAFARQPAVVGNNDTLYQLVQDLLKHNLKPHVIDQRNEADIPKPLLELCRREKLPFYPNHIPVKALPSGTGSRYGVGKLQIAKLNPIATDASDSTPTFHSLKTLEVDGVAVSGGYSPVIHLSAHNGKKPVFNTDNQSFMQSADEAISFCGSVNGATKWQDCLTDANAEAQRLSLQFSKKQDSKTQKHHTPTPLRTPPTLVFIDQSYNFVDFQNDVKTTDIDLAIRENYRSIEHIKRYTATGFGTDQGKTSNTHAISVASTILQMDMQSTSTTTYRPPYTPVTFAAMADNQKGDFFDAIRRTPMHSAHIEHATVWEQVGQWYRPRYYPKAAETMPESLHRECLAVRNQVAMMDVSTLGKIDLHGKDVREFLSRIYTNSWQKLLPGQCRYGLMCDERGMIFDDGVSTCIDDQHFYMTTTTGGAAKVYEHLEQWLQTEWRDLEVYVTSVSDQWATISVAGPQARNLMESTESDIDFNHENFPFMSYREGTWGGFSVRIFRISFSGELSYEINVPSDQGLALWRFVETLGKPFDITPYGTETMHILRAEKGYIIVGQDTDGSNTPQDMGLTWMVKTNPNMSFIGERSLQRSDLIKPDRKQLVGLRHQHDSNEVLPEGSAIVDNQNNLIGHITSSYDSPSLGYAISLAVLVGGLKRQENTVMVQLLDGNKRPVRVVSPVFYDTSGKRLRS